LKDLNNVKIISSSHMKLGIYSFFMQDIHSHDVSSVLNNKNISMRSGYACTEPLLKYLNVPSINRISLAFYNTIYEVNILNMTIIKFIWIFKNE